MSQSEIPNERLRTMQILAGALMMGVVTFAGVVVFMGLEKEPNDPMMAYLAVGFAVMALLMHLFVPAFISSTMVGQLESPRPPEDGNRQTDELLGIFQLKMIIGLALLEGAAFFNLVAYMLTVHWWSLAVVVLLLLAMATGFPTRFKVESWLETKQQEIDLGR